MKKSEIYAKENMRGIWLASELLQNKETNLTIEEILEKTVYLTPLKDKYHSNNCTYLQFGKEPVKRKEALEKGLGACDKCNP